MNAVRSPTCMRPPMTILPPNQTTASEVRFISSIIRGIMKMTTRSAFSVVDFRSALAAEKRRFS